MQPADAIRTTGTWLVPDDACDQDKVPPSVLSHLVIESDEGFTKPVEVAIRFPLFVDVKPSLLDALPRLVRLRPLPIQDLTGNLVTAVV